jgi:hypothetical protein
MDQFEDFCLVTESVRHGMPVSVKVVDAAGRTVHESGDAPAKAGYGGRAFNPRSRLSRNH